MDYSSDDEIPYTPPEVLEAAQAAIDPRCRSSHMSSINNQNFVYSKMTETITLDRGDNTTCTVNLHGATVTSWRFRNHEQLFVSRLAVFNGKEGIRGGIPFVFPIFGIWKFGPEHGFARLVPWLVQQPPKRVKHGDIEAVLVLNDTDYTRAIWNNKFCITYKLTLCEKQLRFHIAVQNLNKGFPFRFNLLLHNYFKVPDISGFKLRGLKKCKFRDGTRQCQYFTEKKKCVKISGVVNRIYEGTPDEHTITNDMYENKMVIRKTNLPETVVWNPWRDRAKALTDFGDGEYLNMVCVEAGNVANDVILYPDAVFEAGQVLQVIPPPLEPYQSYRFY